LRIYSGKDKNNRSELYARKSIKLVGAKPGILSQEIRETREVPPSVAANKKKILSRSDYNLRNLPLLRTPPPTFGLLIFIRMCVNLAKMYHLLFQYRYGKLIFCLPLFYGDGWLSWKGTCFLRQLSGFESGHLSKIWAT
jgi:hypothetical protein